MSVETISIIPLEEVKGSFTKPVEGGEPEKIVLGWGDLSTLEQNLCKLILAGKYGDACDLSGAGQAKTYDRNRLSVFLHAVVEQHDKNLISAFSNDLVRTVLGGN